MAGILVFVVAILLVSTGALDRCGATKQFTVSGFSMQGIFRDGEKVKARTGYYDCHEVTRGDIVLYKYGGKDQNPFIKMIKGLPGDTLTFSPDATPSTYRLVLNGETLLTSAGEPYIVNEVQQRILKADLRDEKIVGGGYLILGNLVSGSIDGRSIGLVGKTDFIGKVD